MLLFYDFFYGCELSLFEKLFCFLRSYLSADKEWYNQAFDYNNPPASMLFERIVLRPSDFEISPPPKGIRENTFYTVQMQYSNNATTDNNGAYVKSNYTKKNYYIQYDTERQS